MGWPRIGHAPLWDLNKIYSKGWLARPLWAALWLYEFVFYNNRWVAAAPRQCPL